MRRFDQTGVSISADRIPCDLPGLNNTKLAGGKTLRDPGKTGFWDQNLMRDGILVALTQDRVRN